ncbi:MAG TPA: hypothetical protein VMF11_04430 [Candidatus Baltobacteraceae bacterium]|nr:hypothetical protein [Candidatus Baltobacteraceae bacterium]
MDEKKGGGRTPRFRLLERLLYPHEFIAGVLRKAGLFSVHALGTQYISLPDDAPVGPSVLENDNGALDAIKTIFGLSEAELADLFPVRRESIAGWRKTGIPSARRASVARIVDLALLLHRIIKPERIPEIVRTNDDWLPDRTILDTIKRHGPDAVNGYLIRLFSYAQ